MEFHSKAYDWSPNISLDTLVQLSEQGGSLLRTKLRTAIEYLDQKYQYGDGGHASIAELKEGLS